MDLVERNFDALNIRNISEYKNKFGNSVKKGGLQGHGGDTGMLPRQLFYCGQFQQQCRCGKCDGRCGPTNGCPCNACVELLDFRVNRSKHLCRKGTIQNEFVIGHKNIKVTDLYFCGRLKNQCYCESCDGRCGPNKGCPCFDCLELVDMKVNRLGHLCKKGTDNKVLPHMKKCSSDFYYCGKNKDKYNCGLCYGICDPTKNNGCPCTDCFVFTIFKINRLGDLCRKGISQSRGGHTGTASTELYYCNKNKFHCHCGTCDDTCGPNDGCPCFDCLELIGLSALPANFAMRICKRNMSENAWRECPCDVCKHYDEQLRNSRGDIAVKGDPSGSGGDMNVESKDLYYCGIVRNECRCGECDGRCGPDNGCPCLACVELYLDRILIGEHFREEPRDQKKINEQPPGPSAPVMSPIEQSKDNFCVVCLDNEKRIILVPCGHYAFCKLCADGIIECAICRTRIEKRVKVFEC